MSKDAERNDRLQTLAVRIADDQPIDWADDGDGTLSRDPATQGLRVLEQVARGFRHIQLNTSSAIPGRCRFRFGLLQVIEPIGQGGQGEVWRAYDPMLDMQVALKLRKLDSDTLAGEFVEEARRLARVRHSNIVSVYGAAVENGRAGIWMELVRGTTLAELLARDGPFPAEDVRGIGLDLCHTLAAVHRHGLLHGDIKPENIMREVSGRIVLMDFGVARELDAEPPLVTAGSPNYLAPELLRGEMRSVASDIYALGMVMFRLLTGDFPHQLDPLSAPRSKAACATRARLGALRPGLPRDLTQAVERALDPLARKRHAHAQAFAEALSARSATKSRFPLAVAALLFVVLAAILGRLYLFPAIAWHAQAHIDRLDAGASRELPTGSAIAMGDRLVLRFQSNRPAYVYVFDDDGSGEVAVLFPLVGLRPANPLASNTVHQLPGVSAGTRLSWQVSRVSERDVFVVLAADSPQPLIERRVSDWRHAQRRVEPGERGVFGLVPAPRETQIENARLKALLGKLEGAVRSGHVRRWTFAFPHRLVDSDAVN